MHAHTETRGRGRAGERGRAQVRRAPPQRLPPAQRRRIEYQEVLNPADDELAQPGNRDLHNHVTAPGGPDAPPDPTLVPPPRTPQPTIGQVPGGVLRRDALESDVDGPPIVRRRRGRPPGPRRGGARGNFTGQPVGFGHHGNGAAFHDPDQLAQLLQPAAVEVVHQDPPETANVDYHLNAILPFHPDDIGLPVVPETGPPLAPHPTIAIGHHLGQVDHPEPMEEFNGWTPRGSPQRDPRGPTEAASPVARARRRGRPPGRARGQTRGRARGRAGGNQREQAIEVDHNENGAVLNDPDLQLVPVVQVDDVQLDHQDPPEIVDQFPLEAANDEVNVIHPEPIIGIARDQASAAPIRRDQTGPAEAIPPVVLHQEENNEDEDVQAPGPAIQDAEHIQHEIAARNAAMGMVVFPRPWRDRLRRRPLAPVVPIANNIGSDSNEEPRGPRVIPPPGPRLQAELDQRFAWFRNRPAIIDVSSDEETQEEMQQRVMERRQLQEDLDRTRQEWAEVLRHQQPSNEVVLLDPCTLCYEREKNCHPDDCSPLCLSCDVCLAKWMASKSCPFCRKEFHTITMI